MTDKLNGKEMMDVTVQTALQLIPYVGPPLAAAYFGTKSEKRFKRIESFYADIAATIEENNEKYASLSSRLDEDEIINLIEKLNDKVEREHQQQKIEYFKNYFLSTISNGKTKSFDDKSFFLEVLSTITLLECEILMVLRSNRADDLSRGVHVAAISKPGVNQYAIVGSIGRLKTYGFIRAKTLSIQIGGATDNSLNEAISLTYFGKRFIKYCLV